jgi:hypothetical protein
MLQINRNLPPRKIAHAVGLLPVLVRSCTFLQVLVRFASVLWWGCMKKKPAGARTAPGLRGLLAF